MVSLSEDKNVQKKEKILSQIVRRFRIGKNKTSIKTELDLDDVCLRRSLVSFNCNHGDANTFDSISKNSNRQFMMKPIGARQSCEDKEREVSSSGSDGITRQPLLAKSGAPQMCMINGREVLFSAIVSRPTDECTTSSGNESTSSPLKRGSSFRRSFSYLFKRNKHKLKDRSGTSDSDSNAFIEQDEDDGSNAASKPLLDAFLPETMPSKRASTGDILDDIVMRLDEDFDVKSKSKCHRRMNSDSLCIRINVVQPSAENCDRSASNVGLGFRSLPISATIEPLNTDVQGQNNSILSHSPVHNTSGKSEQKSLKSLTSSPLAVAPTIRSSSPHPLKSTIKHDNSDKLEKPEKEKKKKEFSSSWQKKFSRHFIQVEDEKVLNYFSCALVSDILLQGHLYITQNYFAFYSNVFGYVTKLLIPTVSVIKISKEKTAKMFPNAVGVTTCADRHVFGSFMSREAAYRLMCSVWRPVAPPEVEEPITQKIPDVEVSECSVEDDSSCSISGNESSSQVKDKKSDVVDSGDSTYDKFTVIDGTKRSLDASKCRKSVQKEIIIKPSAAGLIASAAILKTSGTIIIKEKSSFSDNSYQICSDNNDDTHSMLTRLRHRLQQIFPSDFGVIHVGIILAIILALFSCFLMYKIHYLQSRIYNFNNFRWGEENDIDVYAEVLKWQKQMQSKSTEEAQIVLNSNLEQIAKGQSHKRNLFKSRM
ncbi:uncharacterized protein LOC129775006 isoform X2 [Toxorhynchites rutilus septentrionalis]|uniref:uncharacterized protein LOC129775006 isoform X2 n=2 Tax=Toxorhynchites rutilus septentrionalis TaxID=329112 RepID=UPI00247AD87B|nr:uncharacterized protein LOC129775006 isoform X2 [Toxorhynchites rutilus septentrionalis]